MLGLPIKKRLNYNYADGVPNNSQVFAKEVLLFHKDISKTRNRFTRQINFHFSRLSLSRGFNKNVYCLGSIRFRATTSPYSIFVMAL